MFYTGLHFLQMFRLMTNSIRIHTEIIKRRLKTYISHAGKEETLKGQYLASWVLVPLY